MKTEVLNEKKGFQPIELKINIESERELCNLWLRLNRSPNAINEGGNLLKYEADHYLCDTLIEALAEKIKENNLYK